MKMIIILLLLNIAIIIQQLIIQRIIKEINKLEKNNEYLRKGINDLYSKMIK